MVEAILIVSEPASEAGWPLARVAGLPGVERNLMALRSVGVERVQVACGDAEYQFVAGHLAGRGSDGRLPQLVVARLEQDQGDAGASPRTCERPGEGTLVVDGRFVYHPERLRAMVAAPHPAPRTSHFALPASHPAPGTSHLALPAPHPAPGTSHLALPAPHPAPGTSHLALPAPHPAPRTLHPALYCEDITTPLGRRRAGRMILQSLRKPTDGWFARTVDRSVSLAISSVLAPLPVHPNAVTVGTLIVAVAAGVMAARGTYASFVGAAALFLLASVLDGVDGEIARMKFQQSDTGQWLDTVCDDLSNAVYLAGVTAGAWRALHAPWLLWAGVAAVALDVVTVSFLYWQLVTRLNARTLLAFEETVLAPALRERGVAGVIARLQPLVKRDVYAPLFLAVALVGAAWLVLPATAVGLAITLAFLLRDFARARAVHGSTTLPA